MKFFNVSLLTLIIICLLQLCLISSHMEMKYPAPRLSQYAGIWDYTQIDYDINAPLNMKGNKLCQGKPSGQTTTTLTAGQTITSQIVGSAPHKGGHCQFALSYDNGVTWVVIADHLRTCPINGNYAVTIPSTAPPSTNAIFAWTWINAEGNREYYMNCADVVIIQPNSQYTTAGFVTGKKLLIANQPGYPTVPEFLGNAETGMDLINARPTITVKLSGTTSGGTTTPPPTTTPPTTTPPTTTPPTTTPPTTTPPTTVPPTTDTSNCKCLWAAYCGADSCGRTGTLSSCQCSTGSVCLSAPTYQCRKPGAGGAPVSTTPPSPVDENPIILPTPGANCRCLWAAYCGSDTCGIQGISSACQCTGGTTCRGGPSWQCR
jgi:hypothetical protein